MAFPQKCTHSCWDIIQTAPRLMQPSYSVIQLSTLFTCFVSSVSNLCRCPCRCLCHCSDRFLYHCRTHLLHHCYTALSADSCPHPASLYPSSPPDKSSTDAPADSLQSHQQALPTPYLSSSYHQTLFPHNHLTEHPQCQFQSPSRSYQMPTTACP